MSQLAIFFGAYGVFDLGIDDGNLALTEDLSTAITLSLLTDKRALVGMVPEGHELAGWWADTYAEDADGFGSWLWTLTGRAMDEETLGLADAYVRDALKWMIADKIADRLEVEKEYAGDRLRVRVGVIHGKSLKWTEWWERTL